MSGNFTLYRCDGPLDESSAENPAAKFWYDLLKAWSNPQAFFENVGDWFAQDYEFTRADGLTAKGIPDVMKAITSYFSPFENGKHQQNCFVAWEDGEGGYEFREEAWEYYEFKKGSGQINEQVEVPKSFLAFHNVKDREGKTWEIGMPTASMGKFAKGPDGGLRLSKMALIYNEEPSKLEAKRRGIPYPTDPL